MAQQSAEFRRRSKAARKGAKTRQINAEEARKRTEAWEERRRAQMPLWIELARRQDAAEYQIVARATLIKLGVARDVAEDLIEHQWDEIANRGLGKHRAAAIVAGARRLAKKIGLVVKGSIAGDLRGAYDAMTDIFRERLCTIHDDCLHNNDLARSCLRDSDPWLVRRLDTVDSIRAARSELHRKMS